MVWWKRAALSTASGLERKWCGTVGRAAYIGKRVRVCGWVEHVRVLGGLVFVRLADRSGSVQAVVSPEISPRAFELLSASVVKPRACISLVGDVRIRPDSSRSAASPMDTFELAVSTAELLNPVDTVHLPPLFRASDESVRLRYRAIDLRSPHMQRNLKLRADVCHAMRMHLNDLEFLEVDTPVLFKSSPEGAHELLVPRPGNEYFALTQSPQQWKQMLMVGGVDRYFQFAKCFRDESGRNDRQLEFTQVDLEMSFVDAETIMDIAEQLVEVALRVDRNNSPPPRPWARISYNEAMKRYGSDKPDLTIPFEIVDISPSILHDISQWSEVRAIMLPMRHLQSKPSKNSIEEFRKELGVDICIAVVDDCGQLTRLPAAVTKGLGVEFPGFHERLKLLGPMNAGDLVLLAGRRPVQAEENAKFDLCKVMGDARILVAKRWCLRPVENNELAPVWITEFPLFEFDVESQCLHSTHHPFTAPIEEHLPLIDSVARSNERLPLSDALSMKAQHYDLVLNGVEIGGGSIRLHRERQQRCVLENFLDLNEIQRQSFDTLLEVLAQGAPPHGGIAFGLDRLVQLMAARRGDASSIRDVIAFPKSASGRDLLTGAPTKLDTHPIGRCKDALIRENKLTTTFI